ncbi:hypothetical protein [Ekhidna sp.]|uniref:hypothetical protein n=1 Tax=Ekhidna sp. TaxID=2608089 RepID=UPI003510FDFD
MKAILIVLFLLTALLSYTQSYVDSGIRHFSVGEYDEALEDFESADEIKSMLTQTAIAKIYYYRGMIWLSKAEKSSGNYTEVDPLQMAFSNLTVVLNHDDAWKPQIDEAYTKLSRLLMAEADNYLKLEKKAGTVDEKTNLLDKRISYLLLAKELGVSSLVSLYLGQTNKQAGDIIFESTTNVTTMLKAKGYYEESLKHYELARYDDPFSKDIIRNLLTISKRLGDVERIAEYEKLLELAGG